MSVLEKRVFFVFFVLFFLFSWFVFEIAAIDRVKVHTVGSLKSGNEAVTLTIVSLAIHTPIVSSSYTCYW